MNTPTQHPEPQDNIFQSIKLIGLDGSESFVQELNQMTLAPNLKERTIALAESAPERYKFQGLYESLKILRNNPDEKIILISFMPSQSFTSSKSSDVSVNKQAFELFQSYPNTRFKELPFNPQELNTLYVEAKSIDQSESQVDNQRQVEIGELRVIAHGGSDQLGSRKDQPETRTKKEKVNVEKTVSRCKKHYPSMKNDTDIQILQFVEDMKSNIDLVAQGQHFEGVFCDIDGTLIIDDQINYGVIDLLEQYHTQGKEITIWTGGDLQEQHKKLEELGINKLLAEKEILYKLVSKYDYAGASVEIGIDDFDQNRLIVNNAIKSQIHVDPQRLFQKNNNEEISNLKDKLNN